MGRQHRSDSLVLTNSIQLGNLNRVAVQINSFQIASYEDEAIDRRLQIRLETVKELAGPLAPIELLHQIFFEGLCRVNQDFREVTKMFDRSCAEIEIYEFENGPFSERDIRVKNRYVAQN